MNLVVFQDAKRIGLLAGTSDRGVVFRYDKEYPASPDARSLSLSLPIQSDEFSSKECLPFFTGLLPDGDLKRKISEFLHVSESSTIKLLEALGGECAGAVTLINKEYYSADSQVNPVLPFENRYRKIDEIELSAMVEQMEQRPLLTGHQELRLSLAGAQQKLPLARFDGVWYLPLDGSLSTHILKPSRYPYPNLAVNEYICMQAASLCGLPVPSTELFLLDKTPIYVIERYDRKLLSEKPPIVERIHQEDSCQALCIMPDRKYESDGGPGFSRIISLVNDHLIAPILDIRTLLALIVFNFLMGNCDAHGKNISFLYPRQGKGRIQPAMLAPLYDLVSTTVYEGFTPKLSMKIGGEYNIDRIKRNHFILLGEDVHIGRPYMEKLLDTMSISVSRALDKISLFFDVPMKEPLISTMRDQVEKRIKQIES